MTRRIRLQTPSETFEISSLQDKKIFIATPMYGGNCSGFYTKSMCDLQKFCTENKIGLHHYFLFNESLITRARNYCVDEFLRSDCTHMMFIDSDIGFYYLDVIKLLYLCNDAEGRGIVTGPYPKKTIAWEKVAMAVKAGHADENPFQLIEFAGDYVFNPVQNQKSFKVNEPVEIREGGTGFMMIDRSVFEDYAKAYPELRYKPDHTRTDNFNGDNEITAFFDCVIDPESKRYLSEDYMFSRYARDIGKKIWMCPWMQLQHVGTQSFKGNLGAIATLGATPTANKLSNAKAWGQGKNNLTNLGNSSTIQPNRQQRRAMSKTKGK